ncbi:hypothetical protein Godav_001403 [Gossypium davidsonii]|uniref:Uncharacterized protein n=1 Tax=Gossypium davidsonii TaxID=34287 RepID=A0A7J8T2U3_GOSDV|nr:hypothetical protein [Gossypium davidsonii]
MMDLNYFGLKGGNWLSQNVIA